MFRTINSSQLLVTKKVFTLHVFWVITNSIISLSYYRSLPIAWLWGGFCDAPPPQERSSTRTNPLFINRKRTHSKGIESKHAWGPHLKTTYLFYNCYFNLVVGMSEWECSKVKKRLKKIHSKQRDFLQPFQPSYFVPSAESLRTFIKMYDAEIPN